MWWRGTHPIWLLVVTGIVAIVAIVQFMPTKRNPGNAPIVEISQADVTPGREIRVNVQHRGPVTFDSLTASAVCSERARVWVGKPFGSDSETYRGSETRTYHVRTEKLLERKSIDLGSGQSFDQTVSWMVPEDADPTGRSASHEFLWCIRVDAVRNGKAVESVDFPFNVLAT